MTQEEDPGGGGDIHPHPERGGGDHGQLWDLGLGSGVGTLQNVGGKHVKALESPCGWANVTNVYTR